MNISVEISMYPLTTNFLPVIDSFLKQLHTTERLKVKTNVMSTQIFGDSKLVFDTLHELITKVYGSMDQCPFVIKVLNKDISLMEIKDY